MTDAQIVAITYGLTRRINTDGLTAAEVESAIYSRHPRNLKDTLETLEAVKTETGLGPADIPGLATLARAGISAPALIEYAREFL